MSNSTERFSSRVGNYVKYRPSYPHGVIEVLARECGLTAATVIADLGSGTGLLAKLFLDNGNTVYGVEPNREMREAGERMLNRYANFISVDGTAEATTLADHSIDLVAAGQAFHWFDVSATRRECLRILKSNGRAALIWNSRSSDASPFLRAYEQLLRAFGDDYAKVNQRGTVGTADMDAFFGTGRWHKATMPNEQVFDFDGLKGRLLSSSYAPDIGHPQHEPMLYALREVFEAHHQNGVVAFLYETDVFYGCMK